MHGKHMGPRSRGVQDACCNGFEILLVKPERDLIENNKVKPSRWPLFCDGRNGEECFVRSQSRINVSMFCWSEITRDQPITSDGEQLSEGADRTTSFECRPIANPGQTGQRYREL